MIKKSIVTTTLTPASLPIAILDGAKTNISNVAGVLSSASITLNKGIMIRCDALGTGGTYIKIGNSTTQSLKVFTKVNDFFWLDFIDNINKIYVISDNTGGNASLSYVGA